MTFNRRPTEKEGRARVTLAAASVGAESVSLFPTTSSGSCGSRRAGGGGEQRAAPRHRPGARERRSSVSQGSWHCSTTPEGY